MGPLAGGEGRTGVHVDTREGMRYRDSMSTVKEARTDRDEILKWWADNPAKSSEEAARHWTEAGHPVTGETLRAWRRRHGHQFAPAPVAASPSRATATVLGRDGRPVATVDQRRVSGVPSPERGPGVRGGTALAPRAGGEVVEASEGATRIGRPVTFTDEIAAKMAEHIRNGVPMEFAASAVGIPRSTAYQWMERAKAGHEDYRAFADCIERAEAEGIAEMTAEIRRAEGGGKDKAADLWTSRAWLLERRWPQYFGRTAQPGEQGPTVAVQVNFAEGVSVEAISSAVSVDAERRRKG